MSALLFKHPTQHLVYIELLHDEVRWCQAKTTLGGLSLLGQHAEVVEEGSQGAPGLSSLIDDLGQLKMLLHLPHLNRHATLQRFREQFATRRAAGKEAELGFVCGEVGIEHLRRETALPLEVVEKVEG